MITEDSAFDNGIKPNIQKNHLTLTTTHRSKGLEWDTVFFIGCCDKYFPHYTDNITIQEERRLFYVGITRTKENLYLIEPKTTRCYQM